MSHVYIEGLNATATQFRTLTRAIDALKPDSSSYARCTIDATRDSSQFPTITHMQWAPLVPSEPLPWWWDWAHDPLHVAIMAAAVVLVFVVAVLLPRWMQVEDAQSVSPDDDEWIIG